MRRVFSSTPFSSNSISLAAATCPTELFAKVCNSSPSGSKPLSLSETMMAAIGSPAPNPFPSAIMSGVTPK